MTLDGRCHIKSSSIVLTLGSKFSTNKNAFLCPLLTCAGHLRHASTYASLSISGSEAISASIAGSSNSSLSLLVGRETQRGSPPPVFVSLPLLLPNSKPFKSNSISLISSGVTDAHSNSSSRGVIIGWDPRSTVPSCPEPLEENSVHFPEKDDTKCRWRSSFSEDLRSSFDGRNSEPTFAIVFVIVAAAKRTLHEATTHCTIGANARHGLKRVTNLLRSGAKPKAKSGGLPGNSIY
mmetsp:Transcript_41375/g.125243  ORF Transcript_41375/g.125243 Transcript_41375/m.125243 type:complete len:236 (-) Transcript_41375:27-734(-)